MEKESKKPEGTLEGINVAVGLKEAPVQHGEVEGHILNPPVSPGMNYICYFDAAINFVPYGWTYYVCWSCGRLNA